MSGNHKSNPYDIKFVMLNHLHSPRHDIHYYYYYYYCFTAVEAEGLLGIIAA